MFQDVLYLRELTRQTSRDLIWHISTYLIFRTKYGVDDFAPLARPKPEDVYVEVERYVPPYNGFGSYDDSLGNCFTVLPKAPKMDFFKFFHHDRWVTRFENGFLSFNWLNYILLFVMFLVVFINFIHCLYCSIRQGLDSHVLGFRAKMISKVPDDEERQFIIRVYLMDDTISIFEQAKRNSGIYNSRMEIRMSNY